MMSTNRRPNATIVGNDALRGEGVRRRDCPRILFCGDTHGALDHVITLARRYPDHAVVHLGDLSPVGGPLDAVLPADVAERFWFVPGNHDYDQDQYFDQVLASGLSDHNLDGRVHALGDARVAGVGGIFLGRIWYPRGGRQPVYRTRAEALARCGRGDRWRGGLPRKLRSAIFPETLDALRRQRADILVAHEAPSCHPYGFDALDDLARAMGAQLIAHGHHHVHYTGSVDGGQIGVIGVGYRGIRAGDGTVLFSFDRDDPPAASRTSR